MNEWSSQNQNPGLFTFYRQQAQQESHMQAAQKQQLSTPKKIKRVNENGKLSRIKTQSAAKPSHMSFHTERQRVNPERGQISTSPFRQTQKEVVSELRRPVRPQQLQLSKDQCQHVLTKIQTHKQFSTFKQRNTKARTPKSEFKINFLNIGSMTPQIQNLTPKKGKQLLFSPSSENLFDLDSIKLRIQIRNRLYSNMGWNWQHKYRKQPQLYELKPVKQHVKPKSTVRTRKKLIQSAKDKERP